MFATIGVQDALVLPVGWVFGERIGASQYFYGLMARIVSTADQDPLEKWNRLWVQQGAPNEDLQKALDVLCLQDATA